MVETTGIPEIITKENCGSYFQNVPNNAQGIRFMLIQGRGNTRQIERYMGVGQGHIDKCIDNDYMPDDMFDLFMGVCPRFF